MDLSQYRLTASMEWVDRYIAALGLQEFANYQEKVYHALQILRPGKHYDLVRDVPEDKQELFIKLCCMYMISVDPYNLNFSEDFTRIEKDHLLLNKDGIAIRKQKRLK